MLTTGCNSAADATREPFSSIALPPRTFQRNVPLRSIMPDIEQDKSLDGCRVRPSISTTKGTSVTRNNPPAVLIVVPCFNEQQVLERTVSTLEDEAKSLREDNLASDCSILLVDDGSTDETWNLITRLAEANPAISGLRLARNRGHQNALLCGLMEARDLGCDCAISIDADGQDDAGVMHDMLRDYLEGFEVVCGVRDDRSNDTWMKRLSAKAYYRTMHALGAETIVDHADYRLLSSRVLDALGDMTETNIYLRGMVLLTGFPTSVVTYSRNARVSGESHYSLSKMLDLASTGITSMTLKPIRLVLGGGVALATIGIAVAAIRPASRASAAYPLLLSGIQLVATGIVGEYVGKSYLEAKRRPRWNVMDRTPDLKRSETI